jgi:hypothetical protein
MNQLTEDEQQVHDLRVAAYHEAGHRIIYRRFGGDGDAVVWKNPSGNPDEVAWLGQFRPRTCPEVMHDLAIRHGFPKVDLPDNWRALYGMAGLVAEEILRGETDPEFIGGALDLKIACGGASASDLQSMGITDTVHFELNCEEVELTWSHLIEEWPLVQETAEHLIAEALMRPETLVGTRSPPETAERNNTPACQDDANGRANPTMLPNAHRRERSCG